MVEAQNNQKLLSEIAYAASTPANDAAKADNINPFLRPIRLISNAAGMVVMAVPIIMNATGSVARS